MLNHVCCVLYWVSWRWCRKEERGYFTREVRRREKTRKEKTDGREKTISKKQKEQFLFIDRSFDERREKSETSKASKQRNLFVPLRSIYNLTHSTRQPHFYVPLTSSLQSPSRYFLQRTNKSPCPHQVKLSIQTLYNRSSKHWHHTRLISRTKSGKPMQNV